MKIFIFAPDNHGPAYARTNLMDCMPDCALEWDCLDEREWGEALARIRRSTLLQAWEYGEAMQVHTGQTPRRCIIRIGGHVAGLAQVLEAGFLGGLMHRISLDRGPLWFEGYGAPDDWQVFFKALAAAFPRRPGRAYRIIPEGADEALPSFHPFRAAGGGRASYRTLWLDITPDQDRLRAGLEKKWRNALSRAERSNLEIVWDDAGRFLPWLLKVYQIDKTRRGYEGASPALINVLRKKSLPMLAGKIMRDGQDIAGALFLLHGASATYQIGWASQEGRAVSAHNLLLWDSLRELRERDIKDLDLGGVNDETGGLEKFKDGMGGQACSLAGVLC